MWINTITKNHKFICTSLTRPSINQDEFPIFLNIIPLNKIYIKYLNLLKP